MSDCTCYEDNKAVVRMDTQDRSSSSSHVAGAHLVDLDWSFERVTFDVAFPIRLGGPNEQLIDVFSKGAFAVIRWKPFVRLAQIPRSPTDAYVCFISQPSWAFAFGLSTLLCLLDRWSPCRIPKTLANRASRLKARQQIFHSIKGPDDASLSVRDF